MKLPYVIDSQTHVLADILKGLLAEQKGRSLDVATGLGLVKETLINVRKTGYGRSVGSKRNTQNIATQ